MTDDICGAETGDGGECQNPAGEDGRCWIPSHNGSNEENPAGRPTKLSHTVQENIANALEAGMSFKVACEYAGIHRDTGHRWLRLGEDQDEGILSDFYDRITRARGQGKFQLSNSIVHIAREKGDAATLLRYLQHVEGGEAGQEDENLAGLNLVVPDVAKRPETPETE